ncbi:MAG: hypothetical protein WCC84_04515 [Candidatus Cybelea sp.]
MRQISNSARYAVTTFSFAALLDGCSGGPLQPSFLPAAQSPAQSSRSHEHTRSLQSVSYIYVSNRTQQGQSQLLVYRAGLQNSAPIKTITQGLVDVGGIAVDPSGNVYVANGAGRNVLEFAPGGATLLFTYSVGLVHPIAVTVNDGTLYVSDQGDASNGYMQQVFEYKIGSEPPSIAIGGYGSPPQLNEGIAVDSASSQGAFFITASAGADIPPASLCSSGDENPLGENYQPTLWQTIPLSNTTEPSGLAFDSVGKLYVADVCSSDVAIYSYVGYTWTYSGNVAGAFSSPFFLTIDNDILAIPSLHGKGVGDPGYVNVMDLSGKTPSLTISKGISHPVGAAASY